MLDSTIFSASGEDLKIKSVKRPVLSVKKGTCELLLVNQENFEWVVYEQVGNARKQGIRFKVKNRLGIQCHTYGEAVKGMIEFQLMIKDSGDVTQLQGKFDLEDCKTLLDLVKSMKMQTGTLALSKGGGLLNIKENDGPSSSKIARISEYNSGSSCCSKSCTDNQVSSCLSNSKCGPMNTAHCYSTKAVERLLHSTISKQTIRGTEYVNLKKTLMEYADLKKPSDKGKLDVLQKLFQRISFKENACDRGKIQAVVAGSYPAFVAGKVKQYNDVDIFLLWNPNDSHLAEHQEWILPALEFLNSSSAEEVAFYYQEYMNGIINVVNIGKLQFVVKIYNHNCYCSFHIDSIFFKAFHHVTRWKFLVTTVKGSEEKFDLVICKYIPYKEQQGVVAKRIAIVAGLDVGKYPWKHKENRVDFYPPSLYQQALRAAMKSHKESLALMKVMNAE